MSTDLVLLALLMGAVTYPARALPLLAPGIERLPPVVRAYLQALAPGVLAALAAVGALVVVTEDGSPIIRLGVEGAAVVAAVVVAAWRRNLLLGILVAMLAVAGARAAGLG